MPATLPRRLQQLLHLVRRLPRRQRDVYLTESSDLIELERRMRGLERESRSEWPGCARR
jgi:hypothetical protein